MPRCGDAALESSSSCESKLLSKSRLEGGWLSAGNRPGRLSASAPWKASSAKSRRVQIGLTLAARPEASPSLEVPAGHLSPTAGGPNVFNLTGVHATDLRGL